ncbi:MAG TPA: hypothetical protein EYP85_10015 [Armatimonadetes bacterium]|nr:hypothetical protein [Armatimonadota bacterium]
MRTALMLVASGFLRVSALGQPLALETGDGLRLELSPPGRIVACQLGDQALPLSRPGGFFIADYKRNKEAFVPVEGEVERRDRKVEFRGNAAALALELRATLAAENECLRVDGELRDTSGQDRAVCLSFQLPFDASGWTWYDDLEEHRTVNAPVTYRHTYQCESGDGACSIYPWSSLTGEGDGLSIALPLAQGPRVFVIGYDNRAKNYFVAFFFGLSRATAEFPSRAKFSFLLYRHDPQWGMRSAAERYYRLFPGSFKKRPTYEGYLNYANLERSDPTTHRLMVRAAGLDDASDFGEGYRFLWHMHGCYTFRMYHTEERRRPTDEVVIGFLRRLVEEEKAKPRYYCPTSELLKKLVYDAQGRIRYIGDTRYWLAHQGYNRTDKPGWGLNFRVNEDPRVSDFLARKTREVLERYAREPGRRPFEACLTADAIEGYFGNTRGLNYRRAHFRTTTIPLTFGKDNLQVAMPNTIWDFHHAVWGPLTEQYKVLTYGNANGYEQAFTLPFCDIPMVEWDWDRAHPGRLERYLRSLAHHKIWRFWRVCGKGEKDRESVLVHFARGLAYAIFPSVYGVQVVGGSVEPYRSLYRQYVPAIEALSAAGWEPVPYARIGGGDVVVERFGEYAGDDLHFTLRNYAMEAREVTVALDLAGLGVPPAEAERLIACDLLPGLAVPEPVLPQAWKVQVPANGSRAFWLGTPEKLARHALRQCERSLARIERLFRTDLSEANRERLAEAQRQVAEGLGGDRRAVLAAAEALQRLADELAPAIATKAKVERAKVFFRLKAELSAVPIGLLGIKVAVPRVVQGLRGEVRWVDITIVKEGAGSLSDLHFAVSSPWPALAAASRCPGAPAQIEAGAPATVRVGLFSPAEPERQLLPFLVEIKGRADGSPFTLDLPLDLVLKPPLRVEMASARVFRGGNNQVRLTITNALNETARGTLQLGPHPGIKVEPEGLVFEVPPSGQRVLEATLQVAEETQLGYLTLPFSVRSDNPKVRRSGKVSVLVTTPVPRVSIQRLRSRPTIDGDLSEAVWQGPPTIPQLGLLTSGAPASEGTAVWVAYDERGLYVAFRCAESNMPALKAEMTERGSPLYREDDVEFFLLPPGATSAFQFAINPLGTQSDNFGNTAPWKAAARRGERAWTVEVFVPYSCLKLQRRPARGAVWAAQFGRQQKAKGEISAWTPAHAFNVPERFGEIVFD